MGETFLININCSEILSDKDETQYTMFIDITKMSIVYELVEWIRWIFSFESCLYLTHDNSVIHELEDIQLLSKLQNFEVKPCGGSQCVHKKTYRTLLKNLKLFVNWNGAEVHKYFLHKLSQMDKKLSQKNCESSPKICNNYNVIDFKNIETESPKNNSSMINASSFESKFDSCQNEVLTKKSKSFCDTSESTVKPDKPIASAVSLKKNIQNSVWRNHGCMNSCNQTANETFDVAHTVFNNSPEKNKPGTVKAKQSLDKSFKKYVKPFSLGEILSNIREDFEKQNINIQESTPISNVSMFEEENFDEKINSLKNSFVSEDEASGGRKRKRIRKRKKAKKQHEEVDSVLSVSKINNSLNSLDFIKTNTNQKPSHIRFDTENEDNIMETECFEAELSTRNENEFRENKMKDNPDSTFAKKEAEKVMMLTSYDDSKLSQFSISQYNQNNSVTQYTTNEGEYSSAIENQVIPEDKLIDFDDQVPHNTNHCLSPAKSIQSKTCSPDLSTVFSLKEKFKNAVVIERFY